MEPPSAQEVVPLVGSTFSCLQSEEVRHADSLVFWAGSNLGRPMIQLETDVFQEAPKSAMPQEDDVLQDVSFALQDDFQLQRLPSILSFTWMQLLGIHSLYFDRWAWTQGRHNQRCMIS